jgi:hypothetical protein
MARNLTSEQTSWNMAQAIALLADVERLCPRPSGPLKKLPWAGSPRLHHSSFRAFIAEWRSTGPTASGKTALAIALRKVLPVELISVDSALIYRGIGLCRIQNIQQPVRRGAQLCGIRFGGANIHSPLDILDPAEAYSAADFRRDALAAMAEIVAAGRIPLRHPVWRCQYPFPDK